MSQTSYSPEDRAVIVSLRDSGKSWAEVAKQAGKKLKRNITAESARFQYKQAKKGAPTRQRSTRKPAAAPRSRKIKGKSLDDFRAKFDVAAKIDEKVAEILDAEDCESYWTDDEFRQICGVSVQNWRRHAELDRFKPYQFKKPNFHAWAPPALVEEMKEITGFAGH